MNIRLETKEDYREVENLVRESFWNVYKPGCVEHFLIHKLRNHPDFIPELDFVLEKEHKIIGQCLFMKGTVQEDNGTIIPVLTLGPICIHPDYQKQCLGKYLLDHALNKAKELGYGAVCLEGNREFYKHSGFDYASKYNLYYQNVPKTEETPFFLCRLLKDDYLDGINGEYRASDAYYVNDEDVEVFDQLFPYKKKLKLPGQLFE